MAKMTMCPFFVREPHEGPLDRAECEIGELFFPDRQVRCDIVFRFCGHPADYKACPFYMALQAYYDRLEQRERAGK